VLGPTSPCEMLSINFLQILLILWGCSFSSTFRSFPDKS
jgi:hypothetical protein